jgi:iron complex outermembrane receptor protein
MRLLRFIFIPSVVIASGLSSAQAAQSQSSGDDGLIDEVIVTARHRPESARDVPFAITTLDANTLTAHRVDDTHSLFRQVPGLSLTSFDDGRFAYFQLRGIGPLSQAISPDDGSVVTYVDGVPQPVYASEFAYMDLDRIEVLRGPQGTLYGRNSQGGALNITTRAPSEQTEASARIEAGEDAYRLARLSISGPLVTDTLTGRVSVHGSSVDGFVRNVAPNGGQLGDRESVAARGTLVFTPSGADGARFNLTAHFDRQLSDPFYYLRLGTHERIIEIVPENEVERTAWGVSLTAEAPFVFAKLTTITAVNGFDNEQYTDDTDGLIYGPLFGQSPGAFLMPRDFSDWTERERRLYQEVRLSSVASNALAWTTGAVYFRSEFDVDLDNRSTFSPYLNGDRDATQEIDSYAAFGEITLPIAGPRLTGTLGVRYSRDEKSLDANYLGAGFPGTVARFEEHSVADFDLLTGRAALTWKATDDVSAYATVGRGAKSGGFPRFTLSAAIGAASQSYAESTSWTYETGIKMRAMSGRANFDVSTFYNDVTDEQLFVLDFVSFQFQPVNLDTRTYGIEAQAALELSKGWSLSAGATWTDGEIREASAASGAQPGNRIPNVARFASTLSVGFEGDVVELGFARVTPSLLLTHQYVGSRAADVANSFDMPGYPSVDARLGARAGSAEIYIFGRNVFDREQQINAVLYGPGVEAASLARGRIAGIGFSAEFR